MHAVKSFRRYLSNRYQCCKINSTPNDWRKIIAGVPQESIMVHLLFNMFLNDIFFFLKDANLGSYAENSTMHAYNKNLETVIWNLRQKVSILYSYFYDNYMVLNPGKCHFILFDVKENEQFDLILHYKTQQPRKIYRCNYW